MKNILWLHKFTDFGIFPDISQTTLEFQVLQKMWYSCNLWLQRIIALWPKNSTKLYYLVDRGTHESLHNDKIAASQSRDLSITSLMP